LCLPDNFRRNWWIFVKFSLEIILLEGTQCLWLSNTFYSYQHYGFKTSEILAPLSVGSWNCVWKSIQFLLFPFFQYAIQTRWPQEMDSNKQWNMSAKPVTFGMDRILKRTYNFLWNICYKYCDRVEYEVTSDNFQAGGTYTSGNYRYEGN